MPLAAMSDQPNAAEPPIAQKYSRPRASPRRRSLLFGLTALFSSVALAAFEPTRRSQDLMSYALRLLLAGGIDPEIAAFYRDRDYRPLWLFEGRLLPGANALLKALSEAVDDNLNPHSYGATALSADVKAADLGDLMALARLDLRLSRAAATWANDLRRPNKAAAMLFVDADLPMPGDHRGAHLRALSGAPFLEDALADIRRMHPVYEALRAEGLQQRKSQNVTMQRLVYANLERARSLPPAEGRHVIVDVAAQVLEMWEGGAPVDRMPVVVGAPKQPTPTMAGLIRYMVLRPYWHMPHDLAAARIAPVVMRDGAWVLARRGLEVLSDFSSEAQVLDPGSIDWAAVSAGREIVHLRQQPGPRNMMGAAKFIFPNDQGIYLHDTPLKGLFNSSYRAGSAGCVRVADAARLANWLVGGEFDLKAPGEPETILNLTKPIPVYLMYLTVRALPAGVDRRVDIYGRDPLFLGASDGEASRLKLT